MDSILIVRNRIQVLFDHPVVLIFPKFGFLFKKVTNYWPFDHDYYLKKFELTIRDFSFFF